jgi:hypothetical protein
MGSQMNVRSAPRTGRTLHPKISFNVSGTHFCYRRHKPQGLVRPEGTFKISPHWGLEPATFRLVA